MTDTPMLPVDNPIKTSDQDVLGRAVVAKDFARSVRDLDASEGVVVGILGAWGSGKSSFVNLMREQFIEDPRIPVVEFNPWVFSGDQQLTDVFFREIAAELRIKDKTKFAAISEALDKYGDVLSPIAVIPWFGGWFDRTFRATRTAARWWKDRKKGSRTFRETVAASLRELTQPIVVVIDDIDRLECSEIRDIFKLVRLTASFPNVVYVLAFDRVRIEHALSEEGVSGRAYLEKILQLSFDVPTIPSEILRATVLSRFNAVLQDVEGLRFTGDIWPDVYAEIIEPQVESLRDVMRLGLSARPTLRALGSQIEAVDLLALEAIRVFKPEIFRELHRARLSLTETQSYFDRAENAAGRAQIEKLLGVAGDDSDVVRALIQRLFPAGRSYIENHRYGPEWVDIWKREHRVAYIGYLELYFARTLPAELVSFQRSETAYSLMGDPDAFAEYLDSLPREELESVITGLETYQGEYPVESVVPVSVALLNRIFCMPERRNRSMLDFMRPDLVVTRVVIRLLRQLDDEASRERAARDILDRLSSYSSQEVFIRSVGRVTDASNALISAECTAQLDQELARRVSVGDSPNPAEEWGLLRVYWFAVEHLADEYIPPTFVEAAQIRALLRSALSVSRAQTVDSRHVREEEHMAWDTLVRVAGGEDNLAQAVRILREADGDSPLVQLAERYVDGWRPEAF